MDSAEMAALYLTQGRLSGGSAEPAVTVVTTPLEIAMTVTMFGVP